LMWFPPFGRKRCNVHSAGRALSSRFKAARRKCCWWTFSSLRWV
jgi:hypothetical protein